jgi:hypothetical protein
MTLEKVESWIVNNTNKNGQQWLMRRLQLQKVEQLKEVAAAAMKEIVMTDLGPQGS